MNEYMTVEEVERRLGNVADKSGRVMADAANRALLTTGAYAIKKKIAEEYNVRQKDVDATLRKIKATWSNPTAALDYTGTHGNLYNFGEKSTVSPRHTVHFARGKKPNPKYVFAKVMRGKGKGVPLDQNPKPFVQVSNGGIALFQRITPDPRAALRGVPAPAIPQIVKNDAILEQAREKAEEAFHKRLEQGIDRLMKGY